MKKIFGLLSIFVLILLVMPVQAQTSQQVTVDITDLTPAQRAKVEADALIAKQEAQIAIYEKKIEQFGDWVGVGGEVGEAVKQGLEAVVDVADKFGQTDVGKFTLVLVAWKVMGKDVVKIILGLIFFAMLVVIITRFYRNTVIDKKMLSKRTPQGFWKRPIKEYVVVESSLDGEERTWLTIVLGVIFLLGIWITYAIMF